MPAVPGKGGRRPKRSTEVMGHRSKAQKDAYDKVQVVGDVEVPPADPNWHRVAKFWYESLPKSGQARFFEPSDWAAAQVCAEAVSRCLDNGGSGLNANLFSAAWSAMNDLLSTEGSRRRIRLELERTQTTEKSKAATAIDAYRKRLVA